MSLTCHVVSGEPGGRSTSSTPVAQSSRRGVRRQLRDVFANGDDWTAVMRVRGEGMQGRARCFLPCAQREFRFVAGLPAGFTWKGGSANRPGLLCENCQTTSRAVRHERTTLSLSSRRYAHSAA